MAGLTGLLGTFLINQSINPVSERRVRATPPTPPAGLAPAPPAEA